MWDTYPAVIKSTSKTITWPVVNSAAELNDWIEADRPRAFGWEIEPFIPADVTTKCYFAGKCFYAVDKRTRNDRGACVNGLLVGRVALFSENAQQAEVCPEVLARV